MSTESRDYPELEYVITRIEPPSDNLVSWCKAFNTLITIPDFDEACDFATDEAICELRGTADNAEIDGDIENDTPLDSRAPGYYLRWIIPPPPEDDEKTELKAAIGLYQVTPGMITGVYVTHLCTYLISEVEVPLDEESDPEDEDFDPDQESEEEKNDELIE